jgi:hypothetical protein
VCLLCCSQEFNHYKYSESVFLTETGQPKDKIFDRDFMIKEMHINPAQTNKQMYPTSTTTTTTTNNINNNTFQTHYKTSTHHTFFLLCCYFCVCVCVYLWIA